MYVLFTSSSKSVPRSIAFVNFTLAHPRICLTSDPSSVLHLHPSNIFEAVIQPYLNSNHNAFFD